MSKTACNDELLQMIWPYQAGRRFVSDNREAIEVVKTGEYDPGSEVFTGAEVIVDSVVFRGGVVFGNPDPSWYGRENCILQVASPEDTPHILKEDGSFLPQIALDAGAVTRMSYGMLREGADRFGCAGYVGRLESHERIAMFTRLVVERLQRKCNELNEIHVEFGHNWNETMYVMLMRRIGSMDSKETFTELARRVRYSYISRERDTPEYVEALLLGTSGLLEIYPDDNYTRTLKIHYDHLRNKYSIKGMMPGEWKRDGNSYSHPVLRIAQMASFLSTREFLFDTLIKCRTVEDIQRFFRAEASEYWSTHYVPSKPSGRRHTKRVGHEKANILGINLVVPMMFSYGDYMNNQELKDTALDLLEKIVCESNKIVNGWRERGVPLENAFDSQAILELNNEHCLNGLCRRCMIGRRVIKKAYADEHAGEKQAPRGYSPVAVPKPPDCL